MNKAFLSVLDAVLSQPAIPFQEDRIIEAIRLWARKLGLPFATDSAGNVMLHYRKGRSKGPKWVFAAHMDHPGFTAVAQRGRTLRADFRGGVGKEYFKGARARFFAPGGEVTARVTSARNIAGLPWRRCRLTLDKAVDVPAGTMGMWDLPALRIARRILSSRACDDVVGTASVMCAMEMIVRRRIDADVTALLTRAEEAGLVGALAACKARTLAADALVVAIETSKAQPAARLGDGVVIRVGDRVRTFDPSLTGHLVSVADALANRDEQFRYVRQLMPGGTCESTAYMMYGYCTAALCIPLGNYHNMGGGNRIAAERVHTGDFENLVKLLAALAAGRRRPSDTDKALRHRFDAVLKQRGKYLGKRSKGPKVQRSKERVLGLS